MKLELRRRKIEERLSNLGPRSQAYRSRLTIMGLAHKNNIADTIGNLAFSARSALGSSTDSDHQEPPETFLGVAEKELDLCDIYFGLLREFPEFAQGELNNPNGYFDINSCSGEHYSKTYITESVRRIRNFGCMNYGIIN